MACAATPMGADIDDAVGAGRSSANLGPAAHPLDRILGRECLTWHGHVDRGIVCADTYLLPCRGSCVLRIFLVVQRALIATE